MYVQILNLSVAKPTCLLDQQVDPTDAHWLLADLMNDNALVPSNYVDGQIVLLFNLLNLADGCQAI